MDNLAPSVVMGTEARAQEGMLWGSTPPKYGEVERGRHHIDALSPAAIASRENMGYAAATATMVAERKDMHAHSSLQSPATPLEKMDSYAHSTLQDRPVAAPVAVAGYGSATAPMQTTAWSTTVENVGSWAWWSQVIIWYIALLILFWILFFSLTPNFVYKSGTKDIDTAKVLLIAALCALAVIIIIGLIKLFVCWTWA